MLNLDLFQLKPAHEGVQTIHLFVDTGFVHEPGTQKDFFAQLKSLEPSLFDPNYAKHIHIRFYYRDGFNLTFLSNQHDSSLKPLYTAKGLPYLTESIEEMSRIVEEEKSTLMTKPWIFFFVHGFSIDNQPIPRFATLLKDNAIFSRGFLLNNTIKRDRLSDIQPKPGFLVVSDDHAMDALSFIFLQAKKRIETPLSSGIDMPTKEYFATWSAPLTK
jgi:hypothetical protein